MASEHIGETSFNATVAALDHITDQSTDLAAHDPKDTLHRPANHDQTHSWLRGWISSVAIQAIEYEAVGFHLGNYVIDRRTSETTFESMSIYVRLGMHLLYYGTQQERLLQWKTTEQYLKDQSIKMGAAYDAPESVAHIEPFIDSFKIRDTLADTKEPNPKKYKSFNEFFARELRDGVRPLDDPSNDLVSSSPADCRLTAYQTIDLATKYWIKGFGFSLAALLDDTALAEQFSGGSIVIARLAPQDYHRWHAPISGTVQSVRDIPGQYYTVNPQAVCQPGTLNVFCANRRSVMLLERSTTKAPIAIVAVGAMLVGSIKYVAGVDQPGAQVTRGQCLGMFLYGGSTVVVLYPAGELVVDADIHRHSTVRACETLMKVGWRVGEKKGANANSL